MRSDGKLKRTLNVFTVELTVKANSSIPSPVVAKYLSRHSSSGLV